jgi:type II secretion system protein D
LAGATALAQAPTAPRVNPQRPVTATTAPGGTNSTTPNPDDIITQPLVFTGAEAREVAQTYAELAGKRLIPDMQALGQVSIDVRGKITRGEALRIIEVSLLMNGFTLVHMDDGTIKLLGQTRNPRGYGVPIISDEMQIPEGEQVITFLFRLRYADPQDVVTQLNQYIVPAQAGYNQFIPFPKSQSVMLTENSLVIRKILQILKEVDVPPAEVVSEFIALERADAKGVVEKLEKIFEKNQQVQQQQQGGGPNVAAGVPRPAARVTTTPEGLPIPADATVANRGGGAIEISGGISEESIIVGKIRLNADDRTNRIHIITRPINLAFIRDLIREFDADIPFGEPASRPLRFVSAGDVFSTVVDAITEPGQKSESGQGGSSSSGGSGNRASGSTANRNSNSNLLGNNSRNGGSSGLGGNSSLGGGGGGGLGGGGTGMSLSESLNTQERDSMPEARVIGNTKIIADKRSNTIIVLGNKEVKNKIFALLDKLDVRAPQVMLHTVIGELNLGFNHKLGVNYVLNNGTNRGLFGTGVGTGTGTSSTSDGTGTGSTASSAGGGVASISGGNPVLNLANLVGNQNITQILAAGGGGFSGFVAAGNSFAAIVDALESSDKFKVVSRPSIFTTNNKKAIIASGEEIAVPVNITGGFTGSNVASNGLVTQSSIQYKTVALQLEVLPLINSEREVTLDITQKIDQQSGSDIIDGNSIPRIATRVLQTNVTVPNEGTLALGGLIKQSNSKSVSGIPGLSRLPVVGPLFRKTTIDKSRTELIILIRPVVSLGPKEDTNTREREMEYLHVEPDLESTVFPPNVRTSTGPSAALERRAPLRLRESGPVLRATQVVREVPTGRDF